MSTGITAAKVNDVLYDISALVDRARARGMEDWQILVVLQASCLRSLADSSEEDQLRVACIAAELATMVEPIGRLN